jgi:hypothetical protein
MLSIGSEVGHLTKWPPNKRMRLTKRGLWFVGAPSHAIVIESRVRS